MNNKKTILIVDDIQFYINIQKEYLKYSQVSILTARDGIQALKSIKRKRPDLIITDMYMPNMDGLNFCKIVKSDTELKDIPLIMITAGGDDIEKECTFLTLCDDYITKPINRKNYLSKASKHVSGIERREKRKECELNAYIRIQNNNIVCSIRNISLGGVYIICDCEMLPTNLIHLSFFLPGGTQINCNCKIAWVNRSTVELPIVFGAEFVMLPRYAKEALTEFMNIKESNIKPKSFETEH